MPILFKSSSHHPSSSRLTGSQQRRLSKLSANLATNNRPPIRKDESIGSEKINLSLASHIHALKKTLHEKTKLTWKERLSPSNILQAFKTIYRKRHLKYLTPLIFVTLYMIAGAALFLWIESGNSNQKKLEIYQNYKREKLYFLKRVDEIFQDRTLRNSSQRRKEINDAIVNFHNEIDVDFNIDPIWTWSSAMYFSGTIFTTIGYGDIACETTWGRILTIVYAMFGIPLMLVTLSDLGKFLYTTINEVLDWFSEIYNIIFLKLCHKKNKDNVCDIIEQEETTNNNNNAETKIYNEIISHKCSLATPNDLSLRLSVSSKGAIDKEIDDKNPEIIELTQNENTVIPIFCIRPSIDTAITIEENDLEKRDDDLEIFDDEDLEDLGAPPPRMHVMVALTVTIGWIFLCALLFKLWEKDWTYGESCYFMFISLSTIGLGDLSVKRKDMMVLCFVFVIIGLSLVSMCINVIQGAIEDLYKRLLLKLLIEYTNKMAENGNHTDASMGLMKSWGSNKAAKYLMPLISAEKRKHVLETVKEEAKDNGYEIPLILEDIDEKSGMPKILKIQDLEPNLVNDLFDAIVKESDPANVETTSKFTISPTVICVESSSQTVEKNFIDNSQQTITTILEESGNQTDVEEKDILDTFTQCETVIQEDQEIQTIKFEVINSDTMTDIKICNEASLQTDDILSNDEEIQTMAIQNLVVETQTDVANLSDTSIQTLDKDVINTEMQTDTPTRLKRKPKKITKPRRKMTFHIFKNKLPIPSVKISEEPPSSSSLSSESFRDESSMEKLDWDPIDGLHAEKQRPVKELLKMFDRTTKRHTKQGYERRKSK
ncbi:Potassium channel subfamily K member 18 [Strongyloides ratti]|uniref:Potassium channel subfamily K member 18 n=1 Tax=Strongyloides ratti TaxID=34506 RepID=A0A090KXQ5_STRRB|nr:Potassium channel subfamily K member 18 [Strongyloides ratti]CEF60647.1 Potassium channel subfamily K member 18 [Strongyloides ratti]